MPARDRLEKEMILVLLQILEAGTPTRVEGAPMWLFVVEGAASAERDGKLRVGRFDLDRLRADWKDLDTERVADHWHLFAHDHHWISFSTPGAKRSFLVKLDRSLKQAGLWKITDGEVITNDHFLAAESDGVALAHFLPGHGHRVYRIGLDGRIRSKIDVGGGPYRHSNGSSSIPSDAGHTIFATETLDPSRRSAVSLLEIDRDWKPRSMRKLLDEDAHVAMASGARIGDRLVVVARVRKPAPGPSDDGAIVRYVLSAEGKVLSRDVVADRGNRPHLSVAGDRVVIAWDGMIRVDRVRK
jgi:hypothetical protein